MTESSPENHDEAQEEIRITDKRRIDPETGAVREPAPAPAVDAEIVEEVVAAEVVEEDDGQERVAELTADLQRITAEYANYRKRVDRDRELTRELAVGAVLNELLPVLDDVERARQHDELTGPFKAVGEALEATTERMGLQRYGAVGDEFDPAIHEALSQAPLPEDVEVAADIDGQVCAQIFAPGYRLNDRVVRPARVAVTE